MVKTVIVPRGTLAGFLTSSAPNAEAYFRRIGDATTATKIMIARGARGAVSLIEAPMNGPAVYQAINPIRVTTGPSEPLGDIAQAMPKL